jgi:transcriptional repressor of cell division inhibition gene dicB
MKTEQAIHHAGSHKMLADLLGITPSAVSQWGEEVPQAREWQLKVLRPEWFAEPKPERQQPKSPKAS